MNSNHPTTLLPPQLPEGEGGGEDRKRPNLRSVGLLLLKGLACLAVLLGVLAYLMPDSCSMACKLASQELKKVDNRCCQALGDLLDAGGGAAGDGTAQAPTNSANDDEASTLPPEPEAAPASTTPAIPDLANPFEHDGASMNGAAGVRVPGKPVDPAGP